MSYRVVLVAFLAFYPLAVVGAVLAGDYGQAALLAVVLPGFLAVPVIAMMLALRIRFEATAAELILCNGAKTVRVPWPEVQLCAGLEYRAGTSIVALGEDGELTGVGRVGHVREANPVLLEKALPLLQTYGLVLYLNDLRAIPVGQVWGNGRARYRKAALLVVRADGRAFLSIATGGAVTRNGTYRPFLQVLRNIEAVRAGRPHLSP
jgi:hypothetical protein